MLTHWVIQQTGGAMCESVQCQHIGSHSKQVKVHNVNTLGVTQQTGSVCEMLSVNLPGHPSDRWCVWMCSVLTYWVIHQRQVVCVWTCSVLTYWVIHQRQVVTGGMLRARRDHVVVKARCLSLKSCWGHNQSFISSSFKFHLELCAVDGVRIILVQSW